MKLEPKHLLPYLCYGLEFICICPESMEYEVSQVSNIHLGNEIIEVGATEFEFSDLGGEEIKPILRPLSELDVDNEIHTPKYISECMYSYVEKLISQHYDVFGLIPSGLAIDKNTLNETNN